nr:uncharacterized protein LOC113813284 isoform X2 [Penaeus vannamei]
MSDPADPFENFAGKLLMLAMDKAPELIKLVLEYYKPSKEYEKLAQEICTLRGVQERTSETINTLTKSQDKLSQRFQLLAELTTAQDDLPSGYGRRLQDHVHGLWCLEGLHQDLDVRVEKVLQGLNRVTDDFYVEPSV